ncbi:hypothetical protein RI129_012799 [Pyrocoelia pectoralis]|uniref:Sulfotransferase domain-containing protein n=1 Tax=Pyrocoelia pectoralis TaxID=417401 RepID=A0AAN7V715_9COLE
MFSVEQKEIPDDEIGRIIKSKLTNNIIDEYCLFGKDGTCLPRYYETGAAAVEEFEFRNEDVIVASFPRSGTTWTLEMVWLLKNDLNYDGAKVEIYDRFLKLDLPGLGNSKYDSGDLNRANSIDKLNACTGPTLIKTHLPFSLLPRQIRTGCKTPKIIFVMRNPKDTFSSFYHAGRNLLGWNVSKEEFAKVYLADKVLYGPYWKCILGYWNMRHLPNLLILRYEEMIKDLKSIIQRTCAFLELNPLTEEQLERLCTHLSFNCMKNNSAVNYEKVLKDRKQYNPTDDGALIRSGKVGGYKEEMSPELIDKFDEWIKKNIENTDFNENYAYFGDVV